MDLVSNRHCELDASARKLTVVEPIPEAVEAIVDQVHSRSIVEPWVDYNVCEMRVGRLCKLGGIFYIHG